MPRRTLLLLGLTLTSFGCATADDGTVTGKADTAAADSSAADSASDSGTTTTDTGTSETSLADTTIVESDTTTESDTAVAETAAEAAVDSALEAATDAGPLSVLVYDDYSTIPSHAPAAIAALGGTTILCDDSSGVTTWDAGGFDLVIVEASNVALTTGLDTRLVSWMTSGKRLIFSHWKLDTTTALTTELGVTVTGYSTAKPIYKDASTVDFFAGTMESFTSPISGPGTTFGIHGFTLSVTAPSFLAARADSATGAGAIAVTHGGKVIVNGFLSADFADIDADGDGKKDLQELLTNELAYVLTK